MKDSPPDKAGRKIPGGRLRFTNGTFVPEELQRQAYKKGRRWYVTLADGDAREALTVNQLTNQRLKFKDGVVVTNELQSQSYGKDKKRYVSATDGKECEVLTADQLSQRRLKFTDGSAVPVELQSQSYKKDKKRYVTTPEGDVCEVLTAHELSQRRLKFTDGTFVPDDLQTQSYEMDNKRYVTTVDGNECEVLTAALFSQRQHRARNRAATSMPAQPPELLSESSAADTTTGIVERLQDDLDPYGGVSQKYLKERVPRLPSLVHAPELGQAAFSRDESFPEHLALVRLGSRPLGAVFEVYSIPIERVIVKCGVQH